MNEPAEEGLTDLRFFLGTLQLADGPHPRRARRRSGFGEVTKRGVSRRKRHARRIGTARVAAGEERYTFLVI